MSNNTWLEFKVTWQEEWQREHVVNIDEADIREWSGIEAGPIPADTVVEFLNAGEIPEWHPGSVPDHKDEFLALDVVSAGPAS